MVYSYKGLDVFYKVRGSGDPVIFLHGWGCESSIFDAPAEAVAAQYKAVSIDFPGFGQSSEPDTVWGVEEYTSMLESFVRDNGFDNPVLVGHSFGGRVSILYSSRNPVSKVVLTDAAGVKPKRSLKYYIKVYSYKFMKKMTELVLGKEKAEARIEAARQKSGSADYRNASPRMRAVLSKVVNEDLCRYMPSIKAPVLLFWGENDTATPLSDARKMEKLIPDAGLVVVPGGSHFAFLEASGLFVAVLKNFLKIQ
jgi:pimeloyl-ACP methyl ester carboxylesterase